ncbi:hypothetical protein FRC17_002516 [Serendipita sp. 399]|nr:hypothetical protein FRC17_002516 [Serendipita sp. 399]
MEADGIRGEFALLQEVAVREKRIKLALFGRGPSSTLTKPTSRRPQSLAAMERRLPDSPDRESRDGASSPEIGEMIKRGRKSLSSAQKKVMRRRRSTGALPFADASWRRSEVDRALGVTPKTSSESQDTDSGRRGMDIDREKVKVRDSIVLEVPTEDKYVEDPQDIDEGASTDSSIDLHTPLPRLMLRDGLLSPHSKVLRPPTPEEDGRASWISSKNSLKVPRLNDKRKRRHRDGKLLREGVGLTTGLGWSDSLNDREDEDAPSPLTRRLSSMTLNSTITRKASMASSINSFNTASMASLNLSRSPSLPSIPAGATFSTTSVATKHSASSSGSDATSKHGSMRSRAITFAEQTPYSHGTASKSNLKPSSTMSIIEHAQMLPTASLFKSRNHPLGASSRHPTFNFSIGTRRSSSPTGNSSQSSSGGVVLPITPDADLAPSLSDAGLLKDMSTPSDIQGASGGTSLNFGSDGAGVGLAGFSQSKGWPTPSTPTPKANAALPEDEPLVRPNTRAPEVRYSGGNFSYPTAMIWSSPAQNPNSSSPETAASPPPDSSQPKKPEGLRKPTPRGLQVLTLPTVVAAGGRLSPRAGTFILPSSPSLQGNNPTTPKQSSLPLPGSVRSKSSGNIAALNATPIASSRARSGSAGSNTGPPPIPSAMVPPRTSSRMPQPPVPKHRTLSGDGSNIVLPKPTVTPPLPQTTPSIAPMQQGSLRKSLGSIKSIVSARSAVEGPGNLPKMLGVARSTSAPVSPPTKIGAPITPNGKTGTGMKYRKSAGSAIEATETPARSKLPPPSSTSRLVPPSSFNLTRTPSTSSLTPSVVGVAL